jgi:hypothetical protein
MLLRGNTVLKLKREWEVSSTLSCVLLAQDIPGHNATVMLRAAGLGASSLLEWRPLGLMVCGICDEVHSPTEWNVASQQCSPHVGLQALRQVSNFQWFAVVWCSGNGMCGRYLDRISVGLPAILIFFYFYSMSPGELCESTLWTQPPYSKCLPIHHSYKAS